MKIRDWEILETGNQDLQKEIPEYDYECIDSHIIIPVNYGLGIKTKKEDVYYTTHRHGKPVVTLKISTWRGISGGAIHFYGIFHISLPEMMRDDRYGYTCSCWDIPMFKNDAIELTQILEQWEKDKYPENYEFHHVGTHHTGFYTYVSVLNYGSEMFEKIFGKGWTLKIVKTF